MAKQQQVKEFPNPFGGVPKVPLQVWLRSEATDALKATLKSDRDECFDSLVNLAKSGSTDMEAFHLHGARIDFIDRFFNILREAEDAAA